MLVFPPATAAPVGPVTSQVTLVFEDPVTVAVNDCSLFSATVMATGVTATTTFDGALLHPSAMPAHNRNTANQILRDLMNPVPPTVLTLSMLSLTAAVILLVSGCAALRRSG